MDEHNPDFFDYDELLNIGNEKMSDVASLYPELDVPKDTLIEKLWSLWKMYIDYYVVGNHELKKVMFHTLIGIVLTQKKWGYLVSGDTFCSTRLHLFIIQQSGTGKSQMMKGLNNLLKYLKISSEYTINDNESNLIGTTEEKTGNLKHGTLSYLYSLCWDEGEALLSRSVPFMNVDVVTAQLQSVMDEPGEVKGKGMRAGKIKYPSPTTLIAGSYMFDQFKQIMLQKGFLQRMFLFYKNFSPSEKNKVTVGIELMKLQNNPKKIELIRKNIKELLDDIPQCPKYMTFQKNAIFKWIPEKLKIKRDYIDNAYAGEKQATLETFFNRIHNIIDKIACQHAILLGKKTIGVTDMFYAREHAIVHIECLLKCFDGVQNIQFLSLEQQRKNMIKTIIKKRPGVTQSRLMIYLKEQKELGKWDLGSNRTFDLLKDLVSKKGSMIRSEKGERNTVHLYLRE